MEQANNFQPNWASKPGDTISDILKDRGLSINSFAESIECSKKFASDIISGNVVIDITIAKKLEKALGASCAFWINRQNQYTKDALRIESEKEWVKGLPIDDMIEYGWIQRSNNILESCLNFFQVPDIESWNEKYNAMIGGYSFRTSQTSTSSKGALAAWLRQGEIKSAGRTKVKWNKKSFTDSLDHIKTLTRKKDPKDFIPTLKAICADSGVSLVILPTPSGCKASGATKFINKEKPLILLSFRYLSDDQFWFTFFHEAGHLILHEQKDIFIDDSAGESKNHQEEEANIFAGEALIPQNLHSQLFRIRGNHKEIIRFAIEAGVSPGIVVGQLQHYGHFKPNYMNSLKRWFNKEEIIALA